MADQLRNAVTGLVLFAVSLAFVLGLSEFVSFRFAVLYALAEIDAYVGMLWYRRFA